MKIERKLRVFASEVITGTRHCLKSKLLLLISASVDLFYVYH